MAQDSRPASEILRLTNKALGGHVRPESQPESRPESQPETRPSIGHDITEVDYVHSTGQSFTLSLHFKCVGDGFRARLVMHVAESSWISDKHIVIELPGVGRVDSTVPEFKYTPAVHSVLGEWGFDATMRKGWLLEAFGLSQNPGQADMDTNGTWSAITDEQRKYFESFERANDVDSWLATNVGPGIPELSESDIDFLSILRNPLRPFDAVVTRIGGADRLTVERATIEVDAKPVDCWKLSGAAKGRERIDLFIDRESYCPVAAEGVWNLEWCGAEKKRIQISFIDWQATNKGPLSYAKRIGFQYAISTKDHSISSDYKPKSVVPQLLRGGLIFEIRDIRIGSAQEAPIRMPTRASQLIKMAASLRK